jgi:hypothetical protein
MVTMTVDPLAVTGAIVPITGGSHTGLTVSRNDCDAVADPSLALTVIVELPNLFVTRLIVAVTFVPTVTNVTLCTKSRFDALAKIVN